MKNLLIALTSTLLITACGGGLATKDTSSSSKSTSSSSTGAALIVWNGEDYTGGTSWTSAVNADLDSATIEVDSESGFGGGSALKFQVAGDGYMGFGWNWINGWSETDGVNLSKYKTLHFKVKISGVKIPKDARAVTFQLAGGGKGNARSLAYLLADVSSENVLDGEWHDVSIPLSKFFNTTSQGDGFTALDPKLVREFAVGINPEEYLDFDVFIDSVKFSK